MAQIHNQPPSPKPPDWAAPPAPQPQTRPPQTVSTTKAKWITFLVLGSIAALLSFGPWRDESQIKRATTLASTVEHRVISYGEFEGYVTVDLELTNNGDRPVAEFWGVPMADGVQQFSRMVCMFQDSDSVSPGGKRVYTYYSTTLTDPPDELVVIKGCAFSETDKHGENAIVVRRLERQMEELARKISER